MRTLDLKLFFNGTTDERGQERHRRLFISGVTSLLAKSASVLNAIVSVPLALAYLGSERYGLWMTISSVVSLLGFADLGLGNGLVNMVAEANGRDDQRAAQGYISSAFFSLLIIAVLIIGSFALIYPHVQWAHFFGVKSPQAAQEAGPAVVIVLLCAAVNIPAAMVSKVQLAYQEGYRSDIWTAAGNLLALGAVLGAIHFKAGLPMLVLALVGGPLITIIANGAWLFGFARTWLRPRIALFNRQSCKSIFRLGSLFFVLQLVAVIAFTSDNLVAARVLGPDAVTQYSIPMRMFGTVSTLLTMFLTPLWPAYGEAIARKDFTWVKHTFSRSLWLTFGLSALPATLLLAFSPAILSIWVGPAVKPTFELLLGLALWTVISSLGNAVGMFLNGAQIIRFQLIVASIMAVVALIAKIVMARSFGVAGIIWGTLLAYVVCSGIPQVIYVWGFLADMEG